MMLIAGIEAEEGNSYLPDGGGATPVVATRGAEQAAGAAGAAATGAAGPFAELPRRRVQHDIGVEIALAQIGGDAAADRGAA